MVHSVSHRPRGFAREELHEVIAGGVAPEEHF